MINLPILMESLRDETWINCFMCFLALLMSAETHYGLWDPTFCSHSTFTSWMNFLRGRQIFRWCPLSAESTECALVCFWYISVHNKWAETEEDERYCARTCSCYDKKTQTCDPAAAFVWIFYCLFRESESFIFFKLALSQALGEKNMLVYLEKCIKHFH